MSRKQHTDGPWEAFTEPSFSGWWAIRQVGGSEVGSCDGGFEEADARLMASAPELLEALEAIVENWDKKVLFSSDIDAARDAIAKAKGEQP